MSLVVTGAVHNRPQAEVIALIDTGADITAVPESLVEKLKLYPIGRVQLEGANAIKREVYTYEAQIIGPDGSRKNLEVVLSPYPFMILGRDWLVDYHLYLDGPNQKFLLAKESLLE